MTACHRAPATPPPPPPAAGADRLLTPEDVADRLQVPVGTLRRWVTEGTVPSHRVGRRTRFTAADVDEILARTANPAAAPMPNGASRRGVTR